MPHMERQELLFATSNPAKLAQFAFVIDHFQMPFKVVSAKERFGGKASYPERGNHAATIALVGAQAVAQQIGSPVLVEDTTFHVQAMNGSPGVHAGEYLKKHGRGAI